MGCHCFLQATGPSPLPDPTSVLWLLLFYLDEMVSTVLQYQTRVSLTGKVDYERPAKENRRLVDVMMFVAQSSDAASFEKKSRTLVQGLVGPALRKSSQDVAMGTNKDIASDMLSFGRIQGRRLPSVSNILDQTIQTLGDVGWAPMTVVRVAQ